MAQTKILTCSCSNDSRGSAQSAQFQDRTYGTGQRVHGPIHSGAGRSKNQRPGTVRQPVGWRCTICAREKAAS